MSVSNNVHYLYDTLRPDCGPTAAFTGHLASSFFVKACFSPDGNHILSGSSDKDAYIWQVCPVMLQSCYAEQVRYATTALLILRPAALPSRLMFASARPLHVLQWCCHNAVDLQA